MQYPESILPVSADEPPPQVEQIFSTEQTENKRKGRRPGFKMSQETKDKISVTMKNRKNQLVNPAPAPAPGENTLPQGKRCKRGTRKNRRTGKCEPYPKIQPAQMTPPQLSDLHLEFPVEVHSEEEITAPVPPPKRRGRPVGFRLSQLVKNKISTTMKNKKKAATQEVEIGVISSQRTRCPNKTRKNKFGQCIPIDQNSESSPIPLPLPFSSSNPDEPNEPNEPNELNELNEPNEPNEPNELNEQTDSNELNSQPSQPESIPSPSTSPSPHPPSPSPSGTSESSETPGSDAHIELYPEPGSPNFNNIIANKREFHEIRHDIMNEFTIEEYANRICSEGGEFELAPHQLFARNFLSSLTPYKSMLLYHGLGTGKTCSAISVSEEMRDYMKEIGITKRIYVVAAPTIRLNFKQQLYNPSKLVLNRVTGMWTMNTCMGKKLLKELRIKPVSTTISVDQELRLKESILLRIKSLIQRTYSFIGYEKLRLIIEELLFGIKNKQVKQPHSSTQYDLANITSEQQQRIRNKFDDTLIVIDEVHNLRTTGENESNDAKMTGKLLTLVARHTRNMRLLLMTATPMYNSPKEIIWLLNLMRINDNRSEIAYDSVFTGTGTEETIKTATDDNVSRSAYSSGKEVLKNASYGYISYVKGENPFTFPYRVYPKDHSPTHSFFSEKESAVKIPTSTFNNEQYPPTDVSKRFLDIYISPVGDEQEKIYNRCIQKAKDVSDSRRGTSEGGALEEGKMKVKKRVNIKNSTGTDDKNDGVSIDGDAEAAVDADADADDSIVGGTEEDVNGEPEKSSLSNYDEIATKFGFESRYALQALTMTFPAPPGQLDQVDPLTLVGQNGFRQVMISKPSKVDGIDVMKYEYKPGVERIFSKENIGKWSSKIASVCKHAEECDGIVLVYTEYIEGGAIPVAIALEEHGFQRYSGTGSGKNDNLLLNPAPPNPTDLRPGSRPKYAMITGNKMLTPVSIVSAATSPKNIKGEMIKVIIITKAGSEGIDLKNIRQVHIIDPWYNLSLIEQVIGRAVRNCSHVDLPFKHRNVCIFIHGTSLTGSNSNIEALDVSLLHHAEGKAKRIGNVNAILKKNAVDCNLNKPYNVPTFKDDNSIVRQVLTTRNASGKDLLEIDMYDVKMKPRTDACDYQDECDFGCEPNLDDDLAKMGTDMDTYNMKFLEMNSERVIHRVRALFKERFFYREDELFRHVNQVRTYTTEQILVALNTLINDPYEMLTDYYGREGRLIQIGDYYLFQPDGVTNPKIGIRERTMPIHEGIESVQINVGDDGTTAIVPSEEQRRMANMGLDARATGDGVGSESNEIMGRLFDIYNILLGSMSPMHKDLPETYKTDVFLSTVVQFIRPVIQKKIADTYTVLFACMHHYIDMLSGNEILEIINRPKINSDDPDTQQFERIIDSYIRRYSISCPSKVGVRQAMIVPTSSIAKWSTTLEPSSGKKSDVNLIKYIEESFFIHVDFIGMTPQTASGKWKPSSKFGSDDKTILSKCVLDWFLKTCNTPLVNSIGKDAVMHENTSVPYKIGCTRLISSELLHEFILIDLKNQKNVIHGSVPRNKQFVIDFLNKILTSKKHTLTEFIGAIDEDEGELQGKKKSSSIQKLPSLIVFTELLLRVMDIQDSDKNIRWMVRPCELQLITKVSGIFNANK